MPLIDTNLEDNIRKLRPVLLTLAEALISGTYRDELEASDLVQQTLVEAHEHAKLLETFGDGQFFAWMRTALRHNVLDAVKQLNSKKQNVHRKVRAADIEDSFIRLDQLLVADETSPSQLLQRNEQIAEMLAAIQQLPDQQRKAIILKHLRGKSLNEVAETLESSESAVAGLLHRGRAQLVASLEDQNRE